MTDPVIIVGSINEDIVIDVMRPVLPGHTIAGTRLRRVPGGKGANQAAAAAANGADVHMVGCVGPDEAGGAALRALRDAGISVDHVRTTSLPTGTAMIQVGEDAENAIVVYAGSNHDLKSVDVDEAFAATHTERAVVVVGLETPAAVAEHAASRAKARGWTVILNPSPVQPLPTQLAAAVDVIVVNEHELAELGGRSAIRSPVLVVTLGANGADLYIDGSHRHFPAVPVTPVDTTGAGDAFLGAVAASLADSRTIEDAVQDGLKAGARATLHEGARGTL